MIIQFSHGRSASDNYPLTVAVDSFDEFKDWVLNNRTTIKISASDDKQTVDAKKRRLPYLWHALKPGATRRCAENAGLSTLLRMDLDGTTAAGWDALKQLLSLFSGFAYSTASHLHPTAENKHRYRILIYLDRPLSPADIQRVSVNFQHKIMTEYHRVCSAPIKWDPQVYTPGQIIFLPHEKAVTYHFNGTILDAGELLAIVTEKPTTQLEDAGGLARDTALHTVDGHTFEDLRSALWHPAVLDKARAKRGKYPEWVNVGNRLAFFKGTDYEDQARELWLEWSATGSDDDCQAAIDRWDNGKLKADRTSFSAIFKIAQDAGWVNPGSARMKSVSPNPLTTTDIDKPLSLPHTGGYGKPGGFVVEGLFPEGISMLYGASSSFKSYLIISVCCRIARMTHRWGGRNLKGGAVLYIAAEGGTSIHPRLGAWANKFNNGQPISNFYTLPYAVDLADKNRVEGILKELQRIKKHSGVPVRMVVIDTLSQCMSGDENKAGDMANFIAGAAQLYTEGGSSVCIVHHKGKEDSKGMRGSSAGFANVDAVIRVDRVGEAINLVNEKQRTGPLQPTRSYNVPAVPLPEYVIAAQTAQDSEYTSTEGELYDSVKLTTERVFDDSPMTAISTAFKTIEEKGVTGQAGVLLDLIEQCGNGLKQKELRVKWVDEGFKYGNFSRALKILLDSGYITQTNSKEIFLASLAVELDKTPVSDVELVDIDQEKL